MENYLPLKRSTYLLGDEYYKSLAEKLALGSEDIEECLRIGNRYRAARLQQRDDLARLSDINFVQREARLIAQYLQLVEKDLANLTRGQTEGVARQNRPEFDL